jgi:hypothetical protein
MTTTAMSGFGEVPQAGSTLRQLIFGAVVAGLSAALLWVAASAHLQYSCTVKDAPYLPICPAASSNPEEVTAELRDRIHRNPGDAWAWSMLVPVTDESRREDVLRAAVAVAPNNATVLRWRAGSALDHADLKEAIPLLVQLLQHRNSTEAARVLAHLISVPEAQTLLQPHLKESSRWLPRVITTMKEQKLPPGDALPLVVEAAKQDVLPPTTRRMYMQLLRGSGQWLDAYGLWLTLHKREVPLLYNGSFDQPFVADGFDWEFTPVTRSRAGAIVEQQPIAKRGLVLEINFTGRRFALPIVRQYVFTPAGSYRLQGQYMASKLRSEGGLTWVVYCPSTRTSLPASSIAIQDSGGLWRTIEVDFRIPADCGPIASLQLEPVQRYEATAGIKGHVELDGFKLTRVED